MRILFFLIFCTSLFGEEFQIVPAETFIIEDLESDFDDDLDSQLEISFETSSQSSGKGKEFDQQENFFLNATDLAIASRVNPVTGEYREEVIEMVVAGAEPLAVTRFYNHFSPTDSRYGDWRVQPEAFFYANLEWKGQNRFAAIPQADGSVACLDSNANDQCLLLLSKPKEFITTQMSGQKHPLNTKINFWKIQDRNNKDCFYYEGNIEDGTGNIKRFASPMHTWCKTVKVPLSLREKLESLQFRHQYDKYSPNCWTPYQLPLQKEKRADGRVVEYGYDLWKRDEISPRPLLLSSILVRNKAENLILSSLRFSYGRKSDKVPNRRNLNTVRTCKVLGSDNRNVLYFYSKDKVPRLVSVVGPCLPPVSYGYNRDGRLNYVTYPEGRFLQTTYNKEGKVASQTAPMGPGREEILAKYTYHDNCTEVLDAENNKKRYLFTSDKKIYAIETFDQHKLEKVEHFFWDSYSGNLTTRKVLDKDLNLYLCEDYFYDENQNPIKIITGDTRARYETRRSYSKDGKNLLLTETVGRKKRVLSYLPGTNLLSSELIYDKDEIKQRSFYHYDNCAILIRKVTDDGSGLEEKDLTGIHVRKIQEIIPKKSHPCFGLPEEIKEKSLSSNQKEILLKRVVYHYAPSGQILQEDHYDANNKFCYSLFNKYDPRERLIEKSDALQNKIYFSYDANHNLLSIQGPFPENSQEFTFDYANCPTSLKKRVSHDTYEIQKKSYDRLGRRIAHTDVHGNETKVLFDGLGRVLEVHYPDKTIAKRKYNVLDQVISLSDPLGYETKQEVDFRGEPLSISHPDGSKESFFYDCYGVKEKYIDRHGATWLYTYDIFGNETSLKVLDHQGNCIKEKKATFTAFCKLSEQDFSGVETFYTYDYAGRLIEERVLEGTTYYSYDSLGRKVRTETDHQIQENSYDLLDRIICSKNMNKTGSIESQIEYSYDCSGNCIEEKSEKGSIRKKYDLLNRVIEQTDPLGQVTKLYFEKSQERVIDPANKETIFKKNCMGLVTEEIRKDANGRVIFHKYAEYSGTKPSQIRYETYQKNLLVGSVVHYFVYGPEGRIEKSSEAGQKDTSYTYDRRGHLISVTKPDHSLLRYEYDDLGRVSHFFAEQFDYRYQYDKADRIIKVKDEKSLIGCQRTYDDYGNLCWEKIGDIEIHSSYDPWGKRKSLALLGKEVSYSYNGSYLHTITFDNKTHTYAERDQAGLCLREILPNGIGESTTTYDALHRIQSIKNPFYTLSLDENAYDPSGNLLEYSATDQEGEEEHKFRYDELNQLVEENEHQYEFDSLNNLVKHDEVNCKSNELCQLTEKGSRQYEYDRNGNLSFDGEKRYFYDSLDRLIAIEEQQLRIEYVYDAFGRRLSKKSFENKKSTGTVHYLWDDNLEVGSVEDGRLKDLRILGEGLGAEIKAAVFILIDNKLYLPLHDFRGSVIGLVDLERKLLQESYRFSAFGLIEGADPLSPWLFSSKRWEKETNLIYFGNRFYNPELGRWMTPDPQGYEDGPNLYAYVHNNPLTNVDLFGLMTFSFSLQHVPVPNVLPNISEIAKCIKEWSTVFYVEKGRIEKSCIFDLSAVGRRNLKGGSIHIFVNGMDNTKEEATESALHISDLGEGVNVYVVYNSTGGRCADICEAIVERIFGGLSEPSVLAKDFILDWSHTAPAGACCYVTGHSQGDIKLNNVLKVLPEEVAKRVYVLAIAPGAFIDRQLCGNVQHYVAAWYRDIVPWFDPYNRFIARKNMIVLESKAGAQKHDHKFVSPTYDDAIKDFLADAIKKHGFE